ncbi:cytochrome c biogenesis CcdA family protein [Anaerocellum danielii]|uniref:Cytochrome c biogenesis protein CcdA n=1 Tax=Anaerocellum danielii TaxID=1387557 RepID=A0ABZ0TYT5_9FIRM|nr:cytochrome c biogenesis protein CcdA [Caldicellulosiruptor danielii]WPX08042.1 cytochrome c biogenesis protein CcdA [Caldicellulosiruptor danielii]
MKIDILAAVTAGFLSFFSPCILPLIPVYVLYIFSQKGSRLKNSLLFVLGFSIVFVVLGIAASAVGSVFSGYSFVLKKIAAIIIVLMGLVMLELSPDFLKRLFIPIHGNGNLDIDASPLILGMVLSISWTPCVGPVLTSILSMAAISGMFLKGAMLLFIYSIGFAVPFLVSSFLIDRLKTFFGMLNRYSRAIEYFTGVLLIAFGMLAFFDKINFFR